MVLNKLFYNNKELKKYIEKLLEKDTEKEREIKILENLFKVKKLFNLKK